MNQETNITNKPLFSEKKIYSLFLQGNLKRLLKLSTQIGFFESKDMFGYTPLFLACQHGYTELVEHFIKLGVDINSITYNGDTPLHFATKSSRISTIKSLLNHGANAFVKNNNGELPFHVTEMLDFHILKLFIDVGVDINSKNNYGYTLLHFACRYAHIENVDFLLANNADINIQNNNGDTPLHLSCLHSYEALVNILVSQNANINIKNNDNLTCFDIAVKNNNKDIINILQSYQNYNQLNKSLTPLDQNTSIKKLKL